MKGNRNSNNSGNRDGVMVATGKNNVKRTPTPHNNRIQRINLQWNCKAMETRTFSMGTILWCENMRPAVTNHITTTLSKQTRKKNCVDQPKWNETTKESTKTDATAPNYRTIERIHLPIMRKIAQDFPCVRIKTSILKHSLDGFLGNQRLRVKSENTQQRRSNAFDSHCVIKRWKIETAKLVLRCVYFVNGGKYLPLLTQQFGSQWKFDDRESHTWLYLFRFLQVFFFKLLHFWSRCNNILCISLIIRLPSYIFSIKWSWFGDFSMSII